NGKDYAKTNPVAGTDNGCTDQVVSGVVPNQFGTWFFGRGGWCPGLDVAPFVADITDQVALGADNVITYQGLLNGKPYVPQPSGRGHAAGAHSDVVSWALLSD